MLFVHGGALVRGGAYESGAYDGSHLAREHDVVVVSIQYRLGTLGFLGLKELDSDGVVGNQGIVIIYTKINMIRFLLKVCATNVWLCNGYSRIFRTSEATPSR